jgi:trehalose utilization protein
VIRITVWGEGFLEGESLPGRPPPLNYAGYVARARSLYPDDVHEAVAEALRTRLGDAATVRTATLDGPDCGLGDELLTQTDVLFWWSHVKHGVVPDDAAERVCEHVRARGMGLVVLHAGTDSKVFKRLMGTTGHMGGWRQGDDWEAVWTVNPGHVIASGLPPVFVIPEEEMYCEYFDIPQPDELVFISTFEGGEAIRSGCCFVRGKGRIFYFRPGHESHPSYHHPMVQQVLANAATWAANRSPSLADLSLADTQLPDAAKRKERLAGWFRAAVDTTAQGEKDRRRSD